MTGPWPVQHEFPGTVGYRRPVVLHLGAIDRPHDVFLTPDYLKENGLPTTGSAPAAGPARKAHVLLAHMIRFTHELQNHFAGNIRWGYVNTLLLPYLEEMSESDLRQFVQEMLYEFAQLDVERGGLYRKVILDFDFDLPRQLAGLPALGPEGRHQRTYGDYERTLRLFNESALDILRSGDFRGNPFHSPRIVYHFNNPKNTWGGNHQNLMEIVFKWGNPCLAFSYYQRDFGPIGRISLNDPDFLKIIQSPAMLRGFSSSSLAINLPKLAYANQEGTFPQRLEALLERAASAHREKRLFISRLMAYGNRGPLQFLRHKMDGRPFLKIDKAYQPMQIIGLAEAAALLNHSSGSQPEALARESEHILKNLTAAVAGLNRIHKLNMFLSGAQSESVAYRFAFLDLRRFGQTYAPFVLRQAEQSHPIYTECPNILAFNDIRWRERFKLEGALHQYFADHSLTLFSKSQKIEDPSFYHKVYQEAVNAGVTQLQSAPDLQVCMTCYLVFNEGMGEHCPSCKSSLISPYGWCQSNFSPVHTWCLGKRSEWKIRHRIDERKAPIQTQLPW